jgi:hypothetical protein
VKYRNKASSQKFSAQHGLCVLCCVLFLGASQAQDVKTDAQNTPVNVIKNDGNAPVSANKPNQSSPNAVTRSLVGQGVLKCASRVEQVSNFLGFGPSTGAMLLPVQQDADNRMAHVILESPTPEGSAYVSATFAPNQGNGCGATYDAVMYWPKSCEVVATQQFDKFKRIGALKKDVSVLDGGVATKVFLMSAGDGCVSIKKEVVL